MLASHRRLRRPVEIQDVFRTGEAFFSPYCKVVARNSPDREESRFAVIVGKKAAKKAVTRNRIKRRLRAAIRESIPSLAHSSDIIVIGNARVLDAPYEDLVRHLSAIFYKI
ncbi:MAG: ribonuclease P protein component [Parcubacteria group bacterium SW_4_49_11]|jgi:ribonuclease P protein component|nr:MAG: ribonuclease P protein component [Parcubacteria group bacterium SW_4_49_11]